MLVSEGSIIAATALDGSDRDQLAIDTACDVAQRLAMELHLVHVVDWIAPEPWVMAVPAVADEFWDVTAARQNEEYAVKRAEARLKRELARLADGPRGMRCEGRVVYGPAAAGLIDAAKTLDADLIVVGAAQTPAGAGHLPTSGTATASRLLSDSPVSVLVVHDNMVRPILRSGSRIVIADDLRPETTCALKVASALTAVAGQSALKHVHAYGAPTEHLSELIVLFWELASSFIDRNVEPGDMNRYEIHCRREELARRGQVVTPLLKFGNCRYDSELVTGAPVSSIAEYARLMRADLVVFGHHRAVHTAPLSLGHVSPHSMLSLPSPALMVPPAGERLASRLANALVRSAAS